MTKIRNLEMKCDSVIDEGGFHTVIFHGEGIEVKMTVTHDYLTTILERAYYSMSSIPMDTSS